MQRILRSHKGYYPSKPAYTKAVNAPLYNAEILRLAATIPFQERLQPPCSTAERRSAICGSRVTVDIALDADGFVTRFGQEVRACALGQASAAILGQGVIGLSAAELYAFHQSLAQWLASDDPLPDGLAARFPDLRLFGPARAHPARHPSILLAFQAAAAAAAS